MLRSARFRANERREVRNTLLRGTLIAVISMVLSSVMSLFTVPPEYQPFIIGVNLSCGMVSAGIYLLIRRSLRRLAIPLGVLWSFVIAADVFGVGLTTPSELQLAAITMPALSLMFALFIWWPTWAQVIVSALFTAGSVLMALRIGSSDGFSQALLTGAAITGITSVLGHMLVRRARAQSHGRYLQIRRLNIQAAAQQHALARANEGLARVARRDSLTGLGNRLDLNEELARANADVGRGTRIGVIVLDIDRFKLYNDANGHLAGDSVLRTVAGAILDSVRSGDSARPGDAAFRFGGEEFVILTRDLELEDVERIGRRILARIEGLAIPHPTSTPWGVITASAGIAVARITVAESSWDALQRADDALFEAKRAGRNCLVAAAAGTDERQPDERQPDERQPNVRVRVAS